MPVELFAPRLSRKRAAPPIDRSQARRLRRWTQHKPPVRVTPAVMSEIGPTGRRCIDCSPVARSFNVRKMNASTRLEPFAYWPEPATGVVPGSLVVSPMAIGSAHTIAPARRTRFETWVLYSSHVPIGAWHAPQHTVAEAYNELGSETAGEPQN